jgi:N-acetylmuramoyl-L-alanine amidase
MIHVILDGGHGINTAGKRSQFKDSKGRTLLRENEFNDSIVAKVSYALSLEGIPYSLTSPEFYDVTLKERVKREHDFYEEYNVGGVKTVFLSIHADAFDDPDAHGSTVFYYSDQGKGIADFFAKEVIESLPVRNRGAKEERFKVLRKTKSPAILFEAGFMTNREDLDKLLDDRHRNLITFYIARFFKLLNSRL